MPGKEYSLQQIADFIGNELDIELIGDPECRISGLNSLQAAGSGELSFIANKAYRKALAAARASAVIMQPSMKNEFSGATLVVDDPYLGYAIVTALFDDTPEAEKGIHPSAIVADSAAVHPEACIGAYAVIGERVTVGANTVVGAGSSIGDDSCVGADGWLAANVSIYHGVSIGDNVRIQSGSVIGADGFGFAPQKSGSWKKIYQLGGVTIGNNVEIGACTTVDRGALGDTVVEDGVILDNHVMIAHNVRVGENTAMAAYTGISGSTVIGKQCIFAGRSGTVGHITLCDGFQASAAAVITKSVSEPGVYSSGTQMSNYSEWRKNAVRFNQLNDMANRIRKLEKQDG